MSAKKTGRKTPAQAQKKKAAKKASPRGSKSKPANSSGPKPARCDVCGWEVTDLHCRFVCANCGASRDCSDP